LPEGLLVTGFILLSESISPKAAAKKIRPRLSAIAAGIGAVASLIVFAGVN
jgi:hypothetical protein